MENYLSSLVLVSLRGMPHRVPIRSEEWRKHSGMFVQHASCQDLSHHTLRTTKCRTFQDRSDPAKRTARPVYCTGGRTGRHAACQWWICFLTMWQSSWHRVPQMVALCACLSTEASSVLFVANNWYRRMVGSRNKFGDPRPATLEKEKDMFREGGVRGKKQGTQNGTISHHGFKLFTMYIIRTP